MSYNSYLYSTEDSIGFAFKHRLDVFFRYPVVIMSRIDKMLSVLLQYVHYKTKYCLLCYVSEYCTRSESIVAPLSNNSSNKVTRSLQIPGKR